MLCARVIRGMNSMAKADMPALANSFILSRSSVGLRVAASAAPFLIALDMIAAGAIDA